MCHTNCLSLLLAVWVRKIHCQNSKLRAKRSDDKIRPFMEELVGHQGVSMEEFKTHYAPMLKKVYHAYELMAELEAETKLRRMGLVRFDHR